MVAVKGQISALSMRRIIWRRFRRHKMALVGGIILTMLLIYAFGGALIFAEADSYTVDTRIGLQGPSLRHPFGTDSIGRDILVRSIYGGQISLVIGMTTMLLETLVGVSVGALAGYYGGKTDMILMRLTEAVLVIPTLLLLIVMSKFFGDKIPDATLFGRTFHGNVLVIILIIGMTGWMPLARIVRAEFLGLKETEFVLAARATGAGAYAIIFRHILPNSIAPIIVATTLGIADAILSETYISFLGLGVQPPVATWGNMLQDSYGEIETAPWLWLFPSLLVLLTVLSINFVGDGLRDALDPHSK